MRKTWQPAPTLLKDCKDILVIGLLWHVDALLTSSVVSFAQSSLLLTDLSIVIEILGVSIKACQVGLRFPLWPEKGGLYFNESSADKGFGDGGIIAILKGALELTSGNLEFI